MPSKPDKRDGANHVRPKSDFSLPSPFNWVFIPKGKVAVRGKTYAVDDFYITKYPITYAQYQVFVDDPQGFKHSEWWNGMAVVEPEPSPQAWPLDGHPRENVSWYDAVAFCRWFSARSFLQITLPTEQQWQRTAQGDDRRIYPWGDQFDRDRCNHIHTGLGHTTPVDQYPSGASPYGVFDMAGNVYEWCLSGPDENDPRDPYVRIIRGGSWQEYPANVGCFSWLVTEPGYVSNNLGFRCALTL